MCSHIPSQGDDHTIIIPSPSFTISLEVSPSHPASHSHYHLVLQSPRPTFFPNVKTTLTPIANKSWIQCVIFKSYLFAFRCKIKWVCILWDWYYTPSLSVYYDKLTKSKCHMQEKLPYMCWSEFAWVQHKQPKKNKNGKVAAKATTMTHLPILVVGYGSGCPIGVVNHTGTHWYSMVLDDLVFQSHCPQSCPTPHTHSQVNAPARYMFQGADVWGIGRTDRLTGR